MYLLCVLINVAFVTLLERKILGASQNRPGPNKVRFWGILQPVRDAVKLFSKSLIIPYKAFHWAFIVGPLLGFLLIVFLWSVLPLICLGIQVEWSSLVLLVFLRIGIYPIILRGWGSNSKFSIVGAIRGIAQTISYEIRLSILFFALMLLYWRININVLSLLRRRINLFGIYFCWGPLWILSCIAETNRTPFDFREGESELVSGFNTEFGRVGFALIFMSEYGIILFFRYVTGTALLGIPSQKRVSMVRVIFLVVLWIWVRRTYPRYRYDKLMNLCWKLVLPLSLLILSLSLLVCCI